MATVLQLRKRLAARPEIPPIIGVRVRHFHGPADVPAWLELRRLAFAWQRVGVREWSPDDFHAEFTNRWSPGVRG